MIDQEIDGRIAWTRATLAPGDGWVRLSEACAAELLGAAAQLRAHPLPVLALDPVDFDLGHCRRAMGDIRQMLVHGPGFAIVDRLSLERIERAEAVGPALRRALRAVKDGRPALVDVITRP